MKKIFILTLFLSCFSNTIFAQADKKYFFITWGYNNSSYAKSDIHFSGIGYKFTLENVIAKDRQTPLDSKSLFGTYLNIKTLTIPQFNCHFGKRVSEKWAFMLGWDHMKYVMLTNQEVKIRGTIDKSVSSPAIDTKNYAGIYDGQTIKLSPDFLTFEHTDGYNVVSIDAERYFPLYRPDKNYFSVLGTLGAGVAMVVPRSDVRLFGVGENHPWNISGEGFLIKTGLQIHFTKRLFLEAVGKTGFTYLHAIPTTGRKGDKATQGIGFIEGVLQLGFKI
jgi:hypothetical protein